MKTVSLVLVTAFVFAGCAPGPRHGYIDKDEDVFGKASRMEYSQKRRSVVESIERLKTDPTFTENYDKARKRAQDAGRKLPTIALTPLENNTGDGRSDSAATGQMYKDLMAAIRKTKLFDIIDPTQRKKLTDTVIALDNTGGNGASIQNIGSFTSADFVMNGDLRREETEEDDGRKVFHHFLNLELTDTATATVFWNDTVMMNKFGKP